MYEVLQRNDSQKTMYLSTYLSARRIVRQS